MGARAYPEPGDTFGRYRIVRELGRGGYGSVLEARQLDLDRPVALKVLSPVLADEPQFRDRFAREAAMLAHLDSPHVIQVYEHGEQDGHLFIATQLVQGGDLKQLLRDTNGVSPATALDLAAQVASGLADAHDAGLIHRDIKPSNILVRRYGDGWFAYLCDFGIARATDSDYTRTGGVIGSLGYMAPERHQGADATIATDVYSLGCLLWTLLTGVGPFGGTSDVQVALNHIQQPVPQLPGNDAGSRAINEILQRCLAKAPGQRFASARELRTALLRAASMMGQEPLVDATTRPGGSSPESDELPTVRPPSQQASRQTARQTSRQTTGILPRRRHGRTALVSVAVVVFVAAAAAVAYGQTQGRDNLHPQADKSSVPIRPVTSGPITSEAQASASESPPVTSASTSSPATSASKSPRVTSSSISPPVTSTSPPTPVLVRCWDDTQATARSACPVPVGRDGMRTVFPSLDESCEPAPLIKPGKAEAFECLHSGYLIRYTRWHVGSERIAYYDAANPGAVRSRWLLGGVPGGLQWISYDEAPREIRRWQWSATYFSGHPFSVSVEATSPGGRTEGISRVEARLPDLIGLP